MKLKVYGFHSADADAFPLRKWAPDDPTDVYISIEISIGEVGSAGADLFQIEVITPKALARELSEEGHKFMNKTLAVPLFDWNSIEQLLLERVRLCTKQTWEKSIEELRQSFDWEYEGYAESNENGD